MSKWVAIAAVAVVVLVYFARTHGANAAKVAACLHRAGATVKQSTFLEDSLPVTSDGQQLPPAYAGLLQKAEKGVYDVELAGDTGMLMLVRNGYTASKLERYYQATGQPISAQGSGRIVMLWFGDASAGSRSTLDNCLH